MKEFTSAVEAVEAQDEREKRIVAAMEADISLSREQAEAKIRDEDEKPIEFKVDGRVLKAYPPTDGQLAFMLASLGRGQTSDGRFAAIINIMLECMRDSDKDYLESRLLTRDPKKLLPLEVVEGIFEHLTEQWFRDDVSEGGKAL